MGPLWRFLCHLGHQSPASSASSGVSVKPSLIAATADETRNVVERDPLDRCCFVEFGRVTDMVGLRRPLDVEGQIDGAVRRVPGKKRCGGSGLPAGLLETLTCGSLRNGLTRVDPARRELPAPGVGDEPVPPDHQDAPLHDDERRRRLGGNAGHMVVEAIPRRRLDVDEAQRHPLGVIDRPFAVNGPFAGNGHDPTRGGNSPAGR